MHRIYEQRSESPLWQTRNEFHSNTHWPKFSGFRQTIIPLKHNDTEGRNYAPITTRYRTVPRIKPLTRLASARSIAKAAKLQLPALSASEKTGLSLKMPRHSFFLRVRRGRP